MAQLSYRHHFPAEITQHAIWLYLRFTLSYRDVEELLAERGLDVSCETVRRWVLKFGPLIARKLRQGRPRPSARWHLGEMVVRIAGKRMYLWRAVDHEGEVLDILVQSRRDTQAALRLMRKLLKKLCFAPKLLVTDKLGSYGSAFRQPRLTCPHDRGVRKNNRAETRIKSCGDESARCSSSSRLDPRSVFPTSIPPSTIPSTINDISSLGRHFGFSEPKQPPGGKMRLPSHEIRFDLAESPHPAGYRDSASPSMVQPRGIKQKASPSEISTMPSRPTLMCRPERVWTPPVPGGALTRTFTGLGGFGFSGSFWCFRFSASLR
jgi:transposase-like protein